MITSENKTVQTIYPALRYNDAKEAIRWLREALGFEAHEVCEGPNGSIDHAELKFGGNIIMLGSAKDDGFATSPLRLGGVASTIYVGLESAADVDARYERAKAAGASVVRELQDTDYGSREFSIRDPEGHIWSFGTYRPQAT